MTVRFDLLPVRALLTAAVTALLAVGTPQPAGAAELQPVHRGGAQEHSASAAGLIPLARRGNAAAETRLGFFYEHGLGVPQSYVVAVDLYTRAAEQGDSRAQYLLGLMYDKGQGVPQDFILAHKWLNLATARASRRDREDFMKIRNAVAFKMAPDQIALAQRLAVEWVPQRRR